VMLFSRSAGYVVFSGARGLLNDKKHGGAFPTPLPPANT